MHFNEMPIKIKVWQRFKNKSYVVFTPTNTFSLVKEFASKTFVFTWNDLEEIITIIQLCIVLIIYFYIVPGKDNSSSG